MPTESGKPLIVIGYALGDEPERPAEGEVKWLSFVTGYLKPAIKHGAVDLWLDRLIPGSDWQLVMEQKLRACDIFILLVSRNSLSSYVTDNQIKIIRERQARGETVHFYPLLLTPTHKHWLDLIRDQNLRPRDGKPFSEFSVNERCRQMSDAMDEIAKIAGDIAMRNRATADTGSPSARAEAPKINNLISLTKPPYCSGSWIKVLRSRSRSLRARNCAYPRLLSTRLRDNRSPTCNT